MKPLPEVDVDTIIETEGNYSWTGDNLVLKNYIDSFITEEIKGKMFYPKNISYFVYNTINEQLKKENKSINVMPENILKIPPYQNFLEDTLSQGLREMNKENNFLLQYVDAYLKHLTPEVTETAKFLVVVTYLSLKNAHNDKSQLAYLN